jgi:hypothetical protein
MRFRPVSIFAAAAKSAHVGRCLENAGHSISSADCRRMVAIAYGYASWSQLSERMTKDLPQSRYDEDEDAAVVGARHQQCMDAVSTVTGLPLPLCCSLVDVVRFMGDPDRPPVRFRITEKRIALFGKARCERLAEQDDRRARGLWMTPAEFAWQVDQAGKRDGRWPFP